MLGIHIKESAIKKEKEIVRIPKIKFDEPIFCPYQVEWVKTSESITVVEKSRQIGFSWSMAFRAVLNAATNRIDTIISSYNLQASKEVMRDCAKWARIFNLIFKVTLNRELVNDRNINIFEIRFPNGRTITAISGDSVNFRGKRGDIIIDEAAYREESLKDILAAATACIIHGGQIIIGSTHAGIDSEFNQMCEAVKAGELPYGHSKITFKQAITQGLFKRIVAKTGKVPTPESLDAFVHKIYTLYGNRAVEELDVIPSDFSEEGKVFTDFELLPLETLEYLKSKPWQIVGFRYYDLAASSDKEVTAYYSASVRAWLTLTDDRVPAGTLVIDDYYAEQLDPYEANKKILETAVSDGNNIFQIIEEEPGASGKTYVEILRQELASKGVYNVVGYKPLLSKLTRALPAANASQKREIMVANYVWSKEFIRLLRRVKNKPQPLVSDLCDCLSGIYDYSQNYNYLA